MPPGGARPPRPGDAVIVISHTGETAYARRVRQQALDAQIPVVSITGPGAGWPEAIVTPVRERSETYTVSYTAALAVLALLAHDLGASGTGPDALDAVARRVDAIIDDPGIGHLRPPERAMALVGAGPWHVTAREAALKLREAGHLLCEGFDAERLLHGAAVPYRRGDLLVALQPSADPDGLVAAVTAAAADQGIEVATVEEAEIPASPVLAQIPLTVRLQLLTAHFADLLGTNPDVAIAGRLGRRSSLEGRCPRLTGRPGYLAAPEISAILGTAQPREPGERLLDLLAVGAWTCCLCSWAGQAGCAWPVRRGQGDMVPVAYHRRFGMPARQLPSFLGAVQPRSGQPPATVIPSGFRQAVVLAIERQPAAGQSWHPGLAVGATCRRSVDALAQEVKVAAMPGGLPNHVRQRESPPEAVTRASVFRRHASQGLSFRHKKCP